MSNNHFISYSSVDAQEFAFQLYDSLLAGPPSIPVWLDKRELHAGQDWDKQIVEAIRICDSMMFVMTYDSVEYHKQALKIAQEIGHRYLEANELVYTSDIFSDIGDFDNDVKLYKNAIAIADEIKNVQSQNEARWGLALSQFLSGSLENARSTAESARYDYPPTNHNVLTLMGVIALRQGDRAPAQQAFEAAVEASDILLGYTDTNYGALDAKGLALCGLALCEGESNYIDEAIHAYTKARSITRAPGIVGRVLRLFDELAREDTQGLLEGVREAAGGGLE